MIETAGEMQVWMIIAGITAGLGSMVLVPLTVAGVLAAWRKWRLS